jgi:hypothetical protein
MRTALAAMLLVVAACGSASATTMTTTRPTSTTVGTASTTSVASSEPSTTTTEILDLCEAPHFFPAVLPAAAVDETPAFGDVPFDQFTVIPGAWIGMRNDAAANPVMVLIRGALPPVQFTAEIEPITILDGVPAALGPLEDGFWAVAFALAPDDRCELYSLILYPPTSADEAREVALSLTEGTARQP